MAGDAGRHSTEAAHSSVLKASEDPTICRGTGPGSNKSALFVINGISLSLMLQNDHLCVVERCVLSTKNTSKSETFLSLLNGCYTWLAEKTVTTGYG